tara:strand:+ start:338 stop:946 length:609 start_codon:yes stop_codon:yes gene_type:complete
MKKIIYLIILTLFSSSVLAEGFYGGVGYLKSEADIHQYPAFTYSKYDDKDDGFTLFVGYDLNERFAVEGGYNDLGDTEVTANLGEELGDVTGKHEIRVMTLAGMIKTDPIAENLVIFAKAGFARINHDEILTGPLINTSKSRLIETNPFYGIGANYELGNGYIVRALYEDYGGDGGSSTSNDTADPDASKPRALTISIIGKF